MTENVVQNDIRQLLPKEPGEFWSYIWTLKDKTSHWFQLKDESILSYVDKRKNDTDVYVAVSLFSSKKLPSERGKAEDAAGIFGLWLDIDVQAPMRGKTNLPPTIEDAEKIINAGRFEPSLVINSGYGLQAWWLFDKPWIFENKFEKDKAAALAQAWVRFYAQAASQHGWALDNVSDLARVMRVPGTLNHKGTKPVPVEIILNTGKRYTAEELFDAMKNVTNEVKVEEKPVDVDIVVNENATLPKKFAYMCANIKNFAETWSHTRQLQDTSMSGYDMALAMYGVMAGLTDQEICDLLVCHALERNEKIKTQHYYKTTIEKARSAKQPIDISEIIPKLTELIAEGMEAVYQKRELVFSMLSTLFGVKIENFIAYKTDPREYELITDRGKVIFHKGQDDLVSPTAFRKRVGDITRTYPPRFKADKWDIILQALSYAVEEIDVGYDITEEAQTTTWVKDYLDIHPPFPEEQMEDAVEARKPFYKNDKVCFWLDDFRRWLMSNGDRLSLQVLGTRLKRIGCNNKVTKIGRQSVRIWEVDAKELMQ